MKKKILMALLTGFIASTITGCTTEDTTKPEDRTYKVSYDNTLSDADIEEIPDYQFLPLNLKNMVSYGMAIDIELDLDDNGTYKLTSKDHNVDTSVEEGSTGYIDICLKASGKYEKSGDTITIQRPEKADYVYNCSSTITDQKMFEPLSYNNDHSAGTWDSNDNPEILDCVPATIFTISEDGEIDTWKKAGE